ncbi:MAG: hypothetical protein ACPHJ3_17340 [Rubripirellula sp.]
MTNPQEKIDEYLDSGLPAEDAAWMEQWLQDDQNLRLLAARAELQTDLRRSLQRRSLQKKALAQVRELASRSNETVADKDVKRQTAASEAKSAALTSNAGSSKKKWMWLAAATTPPANNS